MVEIITFIIDLLIIAGVVFAVLFIRKRLSQHPGRKYMPIAFFILFGIIIVASSATVIWYLSKLGSLDTTTYLYCYNCLCDGEAAWQEVEMR